MEQKDINELMQKSSEWRQQDNCCENCERLEERIKVLEDALKEIRGMAAMIGASNIANACKHALQPWR